MSSESRPTVYVETYGCQMNVSDSELMLGKLAAHGYVPVDGPEGADVILVNTCAIRRRKTCPLCRLAQERPARTAGGPPARVR